jgi:hypothetical protein
MLNRSVESSLNLWGPANNKRSSSMGLIETSEKSIEKLLDEDSYLDHFGRKK